MTRQQKQKWALGVLATVFAGIVVTSALGASSAVWGLKADSATLSRFAFEDSLWKRQHIRDDSLHRRQQAVRDSLAYELQMDTYCAVRPTDRRRCP